MSATLQRPEWLSSKGLHTVNIRVGVEKRKPYYTVGENVNLCNQCGK